MPESYDPYELLGVSPGASDAEIRKAFNRKIKEVHPDVSDAPDAAEQAKQVIAAKDLLIERSANGTFPQVGENRYRPARDMSEEEREDILRAHRRKREAEERRRSRRRSAPREWARGSQRENDAFQEEMARRRAEHKAKQEEERQRQEQEEREREQRLRREQEKREQRQHERELAQREREQREREERQRREQEKLDRERVQQEQEERERRQRERQQARPECAWKGCRKTDDLAIPTQTKLGSRRFCKRHYNEYMRFKISKRG